MSYSYSHHLFLFPALLALFLLGLAAVTPARGGSLSANPEATAEGVFEAGEGTDPEEACKGTGCELVDVELQGIVPLVELGTHAAILGTPDGAVVVPVFIDEETALSLAFSLAERPSPEGLSSTLLDRTLTALDGTLEELRIDEVEGNVLSGRLVVVRHDDRRLHVATEPGEALATIQRLDARIRVSQAVLDQAGIRTDQLDEFDDPSDPSVPGAPQGPGVGGSGPPELPPGHPPVHPGQRPAHPNMPPEVSPEPGTNEPDRYEL